MTNLSKAIYPAIAKWMELNAPAADVGEARLYYSTSQIMDMCNEIIFDESLTEVTLYKFLVQENYVIVNINDELQRWIIK